MEKLNAKPYLLLGKIQNYEWGTKNNDAFIPQFLNVDAEKDKPYAEFWIGVHPNAPSDVKFNDEIFRLNEFIKMFPNEILGKRINEKFDGKLPFLLKILSINKALSIQSHPNKKLAEKLHSLDSKNYPDKNHKPEIAIAIDNLESLVGLKNFGEIKEIISHNIEFNSLLSTDLINRINLCENKNNDELVKEIYVQIMRSDEEKNKEAILLLVNRLKHKKNLTLEEKQFLLQFENFGIDVGLFSLFLCNIIELNKEEAIFTPAGIPHAYLKGNIIECMANSDNVVRAGLTPKYKDIDTLLDMLELNLEKAKVEIIDTNERKIFKTYAEEFEISKLKLNYKESKNAEVKIIFVLEGKVEIKYSANEKMKLEKGEFVLIPAILDEFEIFVNHKAECYSVSVP